jgi:hypothetical protein
MNIIITVIITIIVRLDPEIRCNLKALYVFHSVELLMVDFSQKIRHHRLPNFRFLQS